MRLRCLQVLCVTAVLVYRAGFGQGLPGEGKGPIAPGPPEDKTREVSRLVAMAGDLEGKKLAKPAENALKKAIEIVHAGGRAMAPVGVQVLAAEGAFYTRQDRVADAIAAYQESVTLMDASGEYDGLADVLYPLGQLEAKAERYPDAEKSFKRLLGILDSNGSTSLDVIGCLQDLGEIYRLEGKLAEAEATHRRGLQARQINYGPKSPQVAQGLESLAVTLSSQHRDAEAEPLLWDALSIYEDALGADTPPCLSVLYGLVEVSKALGKEEQATMVLKRAQELDRKLARSGPIPAM